MDRPNNAPVEASMARGHRNEPDGKPGNNKTSNMNLEGLPAEGAKKYQTESRILQLTDIRQVFEQAAKDLEAEVETRKKERQIGKPVSREHEQKISTHKVLQNALIYCGLKDRVQNIQQQFLTRVSKEPNSLPGRKLHTEKDYIWCFIEEVCAIMKSAEGDFSAKMNSHTKELSLCVLNSMTNKNASTGYKEVMTNLDSLKDGMLSPGYRESTSLFNRLKQAFDGHRPAELQEVVLGELEEQIRKTEKDLELHFPLTFIHHSMQKAHCWERGWSDTELNLLRVAVSTLDEAYERRRIQLESVLQIRRLITEGSLLWTRADSAMFAKKIDDIRSLNTSRSSNLQAHDFSSSAENLMSNLRLTRSGPGQGAKTTDGSALKISIQNQCYIVVEVKNAFNLQPSQARTMLKDLLSKNGIPNNIGMSPILYETSPTIIACAIDGHEIRRNLKKLAVTNGLGAIMTCYIAGETFSPLAPEKSWPLSGNERILNQIHDSRTIGKIPDDFSASGNEQAHRPNFPETGSKRPLYEEDERSTKKSKPTAESEYSRGMANLRPGATSVGGTSQPEGRPRRDPSTDHRAEAGDMSFQPGGPHARDVHGMNGGPRRDRSVDHRAEAGDMSFQPGEPHARDVHGFNGGPRRDRSVDHRAEAGSSFYQPGGPHARAVEGLNQETRQQPEPRHPQGRHASMPGSVAQGNPLHNKRNKHCDRHGFCGHDNAECMAQKQDQKKRTNQQYRGNGRQGRRM